MLTLKIYAHAMRHEEADLSFADFGEAVSGPTRGSAPVSDVAGRLYPSPASDAAPEAENAPELTTRRRSDFLERETGFEPATLTLARRNRGAKKP